jgi:hypothetical protein
MCGPSTDDRGSALLATRPMHMNRLQHVILNCFNELLFYIKNKVILITQISRKIQLLMFHLAAVNRSYACRLRRAPGLLSHNFLLDSSSLQQKVHETRTTTPSNFHGALPALERT